MPISLHRRWHLPSHVKFHQMPPKPPVPPPCTMGVMDHHTPMPHLIGSLLRPDHLFTRQEVLSKPSPVPPRPGVYVWYFREVPPAVPVEGCHGRDRLLADRGGHRYMTTKPDYIGYEAS